MEASNTAVILINVGSPDSSSTKDVRKYLSEFLNDPRVMDIPWLLRKILVNLVIAPFRAPKSAGLYRLLETEKGFPQIYYGEAVKEKLQQQLGGEFCVFSAMRYGSPGLREVIGQILDEGCQQLVAIPLYPQYASCTTGSALSQIMRELQTREVIPELRFVSQFYDHPGFVRAFAARIRASAYQEYGHLVFSFHGLPLRQIRKVHPHVDPAGCSCETELPEHGKYCYKAACYETSRLIAAELGLGPDDYSVAFQSRMSADWMEPFTDELLAKKAGEGVPDVLIAAPSFVADCLETTVELGVDYEELFLRSGGKRLSYVESLKDMDEWVEVLKELVTGP